MAEDNHPAWMDALDRSYDSPLTFVREVLSVKPEDWQVKALAAVGKLDRVTIRSGHGIGKPPFRAGWLHGVTFRRHASARRRALRSAREMRGFALSA